LEITKSFPPFGRNRHLKTLADRTGGEAIFPTTLRGLDYYLNRLPDVIRNRYVVAYKPSDFTPDGKYRPVRVIATKGRQTSSGSCPQRLLCPRRHESELTSDRK
jgi:hypothetical protein